MITRLTGSSPESAATVARDTGVSQPTLSLWLKQARNLPVMAAKKSSVFVWTIDEKVRVLAEASKLTGAELALMLQREGLVLGELEQWRAALGEDPKAGVATTRHIRALEKEIARKDKALAEAAALLILKKKMEQFWAAEDDDTDEKSEK